MNKVKKSLMIALPVVLVAVIVAVSLSFGLQAGVSVGEETIDGMYNVVYNNRSGRAFLGEIAWDGKNNSEGTIYAATFNLPDQTSDGIKITTLGGTRKDKGEEVAVPFFVSLPQDYVTYDGKEEWDGNWRYVDQSEVLEEGYSTTSAKTLRFRIKVGIYLSNVDRVLGKRYVGMTVTDSVGNQKFVLLYKIVYSFEVVDQNPNLSGSSYLYYKLNNKRIDEFFY